MKVTIGVPALKELSIDKTLRALIKEGVADEIIVVTPDQETASLARGFKKVKVIKEKRRSGKPAAVNKILKKATGDIIVLTDADMIIKKGALKELIKPFEDKSVSVVCGHPVIIKQRGMMGYWGQVLYSIVHQQRLKGAEHLTTNLCAFRQGCVKKIPNQALVDDYIIGLECLKKGLFVYAPKARVMVKFPDNLKDFLKQRVRTFAGYMQVKDWYGDSDRSLAQEAQGAGSVFTYIKSVKHFFWISLMAFYRLIAWVKAFYDYRVKKKSLKELWQRVDSTKR